MSEPAPYEVYAIRYAENPGNKRSQVFLGGDSHDGPMPMDYYVWVITGNGRRFVVDVGFKQETGQRRKRGVLRCPSAGLAQIGIARETVDEIIITHLHYDHAGNLDLFPHANIHLQDREMSFATGRHMCHRTFSGGFEIDDVVQMVRSVYRGKAVFHDGDEEIAPGISLHLIGGHTLGLQVVRVWTQRGWLVLASDAAHYYANLAKRRPFVWSLDVGETVEGYRKLLELAQSPDHIIPGHDPAVMQQYPAPSRELEGIVARVDVAPKFSAIASAR